MKFKDFHLSDEQLLGEMDRELSIEDGKLARSHLDWCPQCRDRRQDLANAAARFVHDSQRRCDTGIPPGGIPRALLKARLRQVAAIETGSRPAWGGFGYQMASAAAIGGLLAVGLGKNAPVRFERPDDSGFLTARFETDARGGSSD